MAGRRGGKGASEVSQPEYNPPAFPRPAGESGSYQNDAERGMDLRDWFAGQMLAAMLSSETSLSQLEGAIRDAESDQPIVDRRQLAREIIAARCYRQADSMLAERAKPIGGPA